MPWFPNWQQTAYRPNGNAQFYSLRNFSFVPPPPAACAPQGPEQRLEMAKAARDAVRGSLSHKSRHAWCRCLPFLFTGNICFLSRLALASFPRSPLFSRGIWGDCGWTFWPHRSQSFFLFHWNSSLSFLNVRRVSWRPDCSFAKNRSPKGGLTPSENGIVVEIRRALVWVT